MAKKTAIDKDLDLTETFTDLRKLQNKYQKRIDERIDSTDINDFEDLGLDDFEDVAIIENAIEAIKGFENTLIYYNEVLQNKVEKDHYTDLSTYTKMQQQQKEIDQLELDYLNLYDILNRNYIHKPKSPDT